MPQDPHHSLRQHLIEVLKGGHAHATFEDAIKDLPAKLRGAKPESFPHSPWMLVEHIRIAQWDILEFSRTSEHASPRWPEGYWPNTAEPASAEAWNKSVEQVKRDNSAMQDLINDPKTDLFTNIAWGDGQTILRKALLLADHNAYHVAQIVDVRRLLGDWK